MSGWNINILNFYIYVELLLFNNLIIILVTSTCNFVSMQKFQ